MWIFCISTPIQSLVRSRTSGLKDHGGPFAIGRTRPSRWPLDFPQMPGIFWWQWGREPCGLTSIAAQGLPSGE